MRLSIGGLGIERARHPVKVTLLPLLEDLLVPWLDLLEAGRRPVCVFGDPAGERLGEVLVGDVVLGGVAVEVLGGAGTVRV